jgi:hypothetical protein
MVRHQETLLYLAFTLLRKIDENLPQILPKRFVKHLSATLDQGTGQKPKFY